MHGLFSVSWFNFFRLFFGEVFGVFAGFGVVGFLSSFSLFLGVLGSASLSSCSLPNLLSSPHFLFATAAPLESSLASVSGASVGFVGLFFFGVAFFFVAVLNFLFGVAFFLGLLGGLPPFSSVLSGVSLASAASLMSCLTSSDALCAALSKSLGRACAGFSTASSVRAFFAGMASSSSSTVFPFVVFLPPLPRPLPLPLPRFLLLSDSSSSSLCFLSESSSSSSTSVSRMDFRRIACACDQIWGGATQIAHVFNRWDRKLVNQV